MKSWQARLDSWEGTAAELAREAQTLIAQLGLPDGDDVRPSERLVRYYTQLGILRRPERRAREAIYGFRQLAEFLACRVLLQDGWPLAKIAEFNTVNDLGPILGLLPDGRRSQTAAEQAVQRLLSRTKDQREPGRALILRAPPAPYKAASPAVAMSQAVDRLREKGRLRDELAEIEPPAANDPGESWIRLELTSSCHVYVTRDTVLNVTTETLKPLGRALVQAILDARLAIGGRS